MGDSGAAKSIYESPAGRRYRPKQTGTPNDAYTPMDHSFYPAHTTRFFFFFLCPQIPPSQRCAISFRVGLPRTLHAQSLLRHHAPGLRWVPDLPGEGAAGSARTRPRRPNAHILELAARRARRFLWPPRGAMVRGMQQLPHPANLSVLA